MEPDLPVPPSLDRFTHDDAWTLGVALADRCRAQGWPVTIGIRIGRQRVFHAALPGTSADNDSWVERKSNIVARFGLSSAQVGRDHARDDVLGFLAAFALDPVDHFPAGGAVPIVVRGTIVGVLAVSGLESDEDHALAVEALAGLAGQPEVRE